MTAEKKPADDPFADLSKLRLDQNFADTVGVKKLLRTVPVKRPGKQDCVRVHPELRLVSAALVELKDDREIYLVMPELVPELPGRGLHRGLAFGDQPAGRGVPLANTGSRPRRSLLCMVADCCRRAAEQAEDPLD